jgi:predicted MFS family arabinose efflux permease
MSGGLAAQFISVTVGWELYERTGDPWMLGLVGVAQVAPALVLTIPAGNLADRLPRRSVAAAAHVLLALAALGLAFVSYLQLPVELVYTLLALSGAGRAFAQPAANTLLAQLLPPRDFAAAYPWVISSQQLASIGGPAAAGLVLALTGAAGPAYVLSVAAHLLFVGVLLSLPSVRPDTTGQGRGLADVFAGVAFIKRSQVYLAAITLDLFAVLLGGAVALLPVFAKDVLMVGPSGLGLLRSAPSVGALAAALLVTRLPPWQRPGQVLVLAVAGFGLAIVGFGLSRDLILSLLCLFFTGATDSVSMVIRGTLQQAITPDRLRGRVAAVSSLFIGLSNEIGAFRVGAVAALVGPIASVVGGGLGTLLVVFAVAATWPALLRIGPLHTLRPEEPDDLTPSAAAARPAP